MIHFSALAFLGAKNIIEKHRTLCAILDCTCTKGRRLNTSFLLKQMFGESYENNDKGVIFLEAGFMLLTLE
jgi:hypothetical protein